MDGHLSVLEFVLSLFLSLECFCIGLLLPCLLTVCLSGLFLMGSSLNLVTLLEFGYGLEFEEAMFNHFGKSVNGNSFILLATFRRFLFRLIEESFALALQSCLGERASEFLVKYLSQNHFSFLVSCKYVGFEVYELRRFIGKPFDIYFHLWNNGVPHWGREREKRL